MAFGTVRMRSAPASCALGRVRLTPGMSTGHAATCPSCGTQGRCPASDPSPACATTLPIPLDKVIAPPYDVVGPDERAELAARHRANAIHVELPVEDVRAGLDKYQPAARISGRAGAKRRSWFRDAWAAFYAYRMTVPAGRVDHGGHRRARLRGARGRHPPPRADHAQGQERPARPAAGVPGQPLPHLGPVAVPWAGGGLRARRARPTPRPSTTTGSPMPCGCSTTPAVMEAVMRAVDAAPVVIADGHHRYETALAYQAERRADRGRVPGDYDLGHGPRGGAGRGPAVGRPHPPDAVGGPARRRPGRGLRTVVRHRAGRAGRRAGRGRRGRVRGPGPRHRPATCGLLTPREQTYAEAGSDLDSSLVALAIDAIPGADGRPTSTTGRPPWPRWPPGGPKPPSSCGRSPSTRSRTGPTPASGCHRRARTSTPSPAPGWCSAPSRTERRGTEDDEPSEDELRNTGAAARPLRRSGSAAICAAGALFLYPPEGSRVTSPWA